jgi:uncharacterized membrane protein
MPLTAGNIAEPTSTGLAANVGGALAYVLGPITGVALYVLEKDNRFVRFHAAQSIMVGAVTIALYIALSILSTVLAFIPVLGWIVALALTLGIGAASFVLWLMLMWRAFHGAEWEAPVAGPLARKMVPRLPIVTGVANL